MKKQHFVFFALLVIAMVFSGCSSGDNQVQNDQQNNRWNQEQAAEIENDQALMQNENFEQLTFIDLNIGQRVLIMGKKNSDGNISANQIMIGNDEVAFKNMSEIESSFMNNNSGDQAVDNQSIQPEVNFNGQRPDFTEMQNMSEEDRVKMMEKIRTQRETGVIGQPSNAEESLIRFIGEIIKIDETNVVLKLDSGGSKLIFYSKETKILKSLK